MRNEVVAVICTAPSGIPAVFIAQVTVTQGQYDDGEHYELAEELATEADYEGPFVCFDSSEHGILSAAVSELSELVIKEIPEREILLPTHRF